MSFTNDRGISRNKCAAAGESGGEPPQSRRSALPDGFQWRKESGLRALQHRFVPATALFVKGIIPLFGGFFLILGQYMAMMHDIRVVTHQPRD